MRFYRPSELSKGDVRLTEADRQSVPQTWSGNTKRTIAEARVEVSVGDSNFWLIPRLGGCVRLIGTTIIFATSAALDGTVAVIYPHAVTFCQQFYFFKMVSQYF